MTAKSEAIQEVDRTEQWKNVSTDLFSDESFLAGRSAGTEGVAQSRSSKFLRYFEFTWLLAILGMICVGGIGAVAAYHDYSKPDPLLDMTHKINALASSVTALQERVATNTDMTALEERVATISDNQAREEVAQRRAVEASEVALQRTFGELSDRLDRVRNEAQERDAGMALRLDTLEVKELSPAVALAAPQSAATTSLSVSPASGLPPSARVPALTSPSASVDGAKKVTKLSAHKKMRRTAYWSRGTK